MDYQTVVGALFDGDRADDPSPQPVAEGGSARRLRDAFEPVSMHAVWSPLVHERLEALGLDFFMTYVWGRACVLGEPSGAVVASAFGAFEPAVIAGVYDQARAIVSRDDVLRTTVDSTTESLASVLGQAVEPAVRVAATRLADVVDSMDATGRPLFSGVQALDWPADPYGRLWQACLALREYRGDAHIAAYVGAGFGPVHMNILTELWLGYPLGEYSGTRSWSEAATQTALGSLRSRGLVDGEQLTLDGRRVRTKIEDRTDVMQQPVVAALGDELDSIVDQLRGWSARCIEAGTFPPDPRKRAAG